MNNDLLLEWASERGTGSWQQLRDAHEWLSAAATDGGPWRPTAGFAARSLTTLGHIEVDWENGRWAAAPPLLTILPSAGGHALLTGARTRALVDRLADATDDPCLYMVQSPQRFAPSAILIACEDETNIERLAERLQIDYEFSVSDRFSELLPELDSYLALASAPRAPRGYGVARLELTTLEWVDAEHDRAVGLYRYDAYGRPTYRLVAGQDETYKVDLAIGAWVALSRWGENRLRYSEEDVNGTLAVPVATPLPTLHARAAALCSGLAPGRIGNTLWYRNVPRRVAERIARSLDQTLVDA
jgi:hypothetical protein